MKEKKDNIYIYLWEEFNTIYVGRTINPKSRHYTHKHRESERTYQFSSEHHVEHPKMIIIENDLSVEDGVEREKYWINYYKENSPYNVLNKSRGGQKGRRMSKLTEEEKKQHQKEYYQKNKEKIRAYQKLYEEKNKEKIRKRNREYKAKQYKIKPRKPKRTKEEILAYNKQYKKEHKEKVNLHQKKYRERNREKIKERNKKYYQIHKLNN